MNRESIIEQLVNISKDHVWCGETDEQLYNHFETELDNGEIAWIEMGDKIIAFVDWAWISDEGDINLVETGRSTHGPVLFLMNVWCSRKGLMWKLKASLPPHQWIAWRTRSDYNKIHAPFGWPKKESEVDVY